MKCSKRLKKIRYDSGFRHSDAGVVKVMAVVTKDAYAWVADEPVRELKWPGTTTYTYHKGLVRKMRLDDAPFGVIDRVNFVEGDLRISNNKKRLGFKIQNLHR